jgi:crossover junction endodeoxyribonuclease RusA
MSADTITTAHILLAWPSKPLWQNYRCHSLQKANVVAHARRDAFYTALEAGLRRMPRGEGWTHHLSFDFSPPNRIKRDLQNMPATQKAAIDGIADALKVDDATFKVKWPEEFGTVSDSGGSVLVVVRAVPAEKGKAV